VGGITPDSERPTIVELRNVEKQFGGAVALRGVSLEVKAGAVHALVGENGAGKSTLGKIIAGVHRPDEGELLLDGEPVSFRSPRDALTAGVTIIAQELALARRRSVLDNVYLGNTPNVLGRVKTRQLRQQYADLTERLGISVDPDRTVGELRLAEAQKVEILRAVARGARLIVMDEPTAPFSRQDAEELFGVVAALVEAGTTIVYVSHNLEDVLRLSSEVTILRDGALVRTGPAAEETTDSLVTGMLGRSLDVVFPSKRYPDEQAPVVCSVRGLACEELVEDVSFDIRAGEILGIAGMVGSGRSELARAIFGADRRAAGEVLVDGEPVSARHPRTAIRAGIALLPEDRKTQGLLMLQSAVANVSVASLGDVSRAGWIASRRERASADEVIKKVDVRAVQPDAPAWTLSGGNQQKVLFARWLRRDPRLLIVDEPTRGVDIGAKRSIYELLADLAGRGVAILMISSELEEVIGLAHRVLVMRRGHIVGDFDVRRAEARTIMNAALAVPGSNKEALGV
jgi:simple sugar transport system ATP-binding protein/ribose transport system ATP-binding protein